MTQHTKTRAHEKLPAHVLVVEDDAVLGLTIEQALLDAGADPTLAMHSGRHAGKRQTAA